MIGDIQIEQRIVDLLEENYERLRLESGQALTENVKQAALQQVIFYFRKLRHIAENVTDTEVRLTLPNQKTAQARPFTIEGIVDIIHEADETWMYDLKTHDADYIEGHKYLYEEQLDVYSHIWQELRQNKLDRTAIISTVLPSKLRQAVQKGDEKRIAKEIQEWRPVIEIPFEQNKVALAIENFANVVDKIENHEFSPPSLMTLKERVPGKKSSYLTNMCRNCDVRFSCKPYRQHMLESVQGNESQLLRYIATVGEDLEMAESLDANLKMDKIETIMRSENDY